MHPIQEWNNIEEVAVIPGYRAKFIHSANMTFALWDIDRGIPLPEHSHPHEQVTHLLEGEFELVVNGISRVMKAGSVAVIPSHSRHSGMPVTACRILDVFYPLREDYHPSNVQSILRDAKDLT